VRSRQLSIGFLLIFQALVFVTPIAVKSFHVHSDMIRIHTSGSDPSYEKAAKHCEICSFDFVDFIRNSLTSFFTIESLTDCPTTESVKAGYHVSCASFHLRAPPFS
jgi:hypothetical protein